MSKQVDWNKQIYETFCSLALLSPEDQKILLTRIRENWTITKQSMEFGMSVSAVKRRIANMKKLYDQVQPLAPDKLPKRRKSAVEDYMDDN